AGLVLVDLGDADNERHLVLEPGRGGLPDDGEAVDLALPADLAPLERVAVADGADDARLRGVEPTLRAALEHELVLSRAIPVRSVFVDRDRYRLLSGAHLGPPGRIYLSMAV